MSVNHLVAAVQSPANATAACATARSFVTCAGFVLRSGLVGGAEGFSDPAANGWPEEVPGSPVIPPLR
jgi:hypothetical protein